MSPPPINTPLGGRAIYPSVSPYFGPSDPPPSQRRRMRTPILQFFHPPPGVAIIFHRKISCVSRLKSVTRSIRAKIDDSLPVFCVVFRKSRTKSEYLGSGCGGDGGPTTRGFASRAMAFPAAAVVMTTAALPSRRVSRAGYLYSSGP